MKAYLYSLLILSALGAVLAIVRDVLAESGKVAVAKVVSSVANNIARWVFILSILMTGALLWLY